MQDVEEEFETIVGLRLNSYDTLLTAIDTLILSLDEWSRESDSKVVLPQAQWKEQSREISTQWKDSYAQLIKFGKSLDKKFKVDSSSLSAFASTTKSHPETLNMALFHHFYRSGQFDLANIFQQEIKASSSILNGAVDTSLKVVANSSNNIVDSDTKEKYVKLHEICTQLRLGNLNPAIEWASSIHENLKFRGSDLEFQLLKSQFVSLLLNGQITEAIQHSKCQFQKFTEKNQKDIQRLMGCLAFVHKLKASPYASLLEESLNSEKLEVNFTKEYSVWMELPLQSAIEQCVNIGVEALPKIMKVSSLMKDRSIEWTSNNELPVEIHLRDQVKFHSVFSCPVSKEPATLQNPPMVIPCGHVISKEALKRLVKGGQATSKFKCPYCPSEATFSQAIRVHL